ncbi:MAG: ATP-binding protein [Acidimicrobiales bacterium]
MTAATGTDTADVEIAFPATEALVTLARFTAATVAAHAGFDIDEVEDLRLAVDELCAAVGAFGDGSSIRVTFGRRGDTVMVRCVSEPSPGGSPDAGTVGDDWRPSDLSEQLIGALVDRYGFERHLDRPCGWLEKKRGQATR